MPQDSLRSAVYRSFITCDDPKGVIECRTRRKSKSNSKRLENNLESGKFCNDLNSSTSSNAENGKEMGFISTKEELVKPSSFQLMEVSKGASKLNQVIDSYPQGMTFDRNSKQIAKDLLKGALDLQESLMVLGKLQETSQHMGKLRRKQKEEPKVERNEEFWIGRSKSDRYADYNYQTRFEKPRFSVDGSSRDCFDELRTAIRDSLARQNLLPPNFSEKTNYCDEKILDSSVDIPSTSSTQSSTLNFTSFTSSDASFSSEGPKKSKGSNLIAKLMGLEEIPSQQVQVSSPKKFESEKISNQRRPAFEIDMAKTRKHQSGTYKVDTEEKKLKEIVENMRFKGLLKGNSAEGYRYQSHYSDNFSSKKGFYEDALPIVIMKPMNLSSEDAEKLQVQKFDWKVEAVDSNELLKWEMKEVRAQMKDQRKGVLDFDEVCRRLKGEEKPNKMLGQEGVKEFKELKAKPEEKMGKTKEKISSNKLNDSGPISQKERKKASEKKVGRIDKLMGPKKKPVEMENVKSKVASKSHDQAKVYSTKERKPEAESINARKSVFQQKSNSSTVVSKHKPAMTQKNGDRKKNPKPDKEPMTEPFVEEAVDYKHARKLIDQNCEDEPNMENISNISAQSLDKGGTDASEDQIKGRCDHSHNSIKNVTVENTQHESVTTLWKLFSSSSTFLKYAEELFDVKGNPTIHLQMANLNDSEIADKRLLLDCATELMQQKNLNSQHPPFLTPKCSKTFIPLAQLVNEVCKGIESLRIYSKNANEKLLTESLDSVLERDMMGKGLASGAWELGWKHGYSLDDVEQVVGDIEKRVFDELIEGMFTELLL